MSDPHETSSADELPREMNPDGSEVLRHERKFAEDDPALPHMLSPDEMQTIQSHLEEHIGPFENVLDEIESPDLHIDIIPIPASEERPFLTLCTMGMSAAPMCMPDDADVLRFAELLIALPPDWPLSVEEFKSLGEDAWWPLRWLKELARLPINYDTFLAPGHTVPNGNPPEPFSENCPFAAFLVTPQSVAEESFDLLEVGNRLVAFLQMIPLYPEELKFKLQHGTDALLERLSTLYEDGTVADLADPARPSAVP
jgi:hypothetical protein